MPSNQNLFTFANKSTGTQNNRELMVKKKRHLTQQSAECRVRSQSAEHFPPSLYTVTLSKKKNPFKSASCHKQPHHPTPKRRAGVRLAWERPQQDVWRQIHSQLSCNVTRALVTLALSTLNFTDSTRETDTALSVCSTGQRCQHAAGTLTEVLQFGTVAVYAATDVCSLGKSRELLQWAMNHDRTGAFPCGQKEMRKGTESCLTDTQWYLSVPLTLVPAEKVFFSSSFLSFRRTAPVPSPQVAEWENNNLTTIKVLFNVYWRLVISFHNST